MKVCFFLGGFYQNGGIGRVTSILANRLAEESNIEVLTLGYFNPHKADIYELSPNIYKSFFMDSYQSMAKLLLFGGEKNCANFFATTT